MLEVKQFKTNPKFNPSIVLKPPASDLAMKLLLQRKYIGEYLTERKITSIQQLQEFMKSSILRSTRIDLDEIFCLYALTKVPADFKLNNQRDAVRELRQYFYSKSLQELNKLKLLEYAHYAYCTDILLF